MGSLSFLVKKLLFLSFDVFHALWNILAHACLYVP